MLVRRGKGAARSCDGSFLAMLAAIVLSALALCGSASPLALSPSRILVGYTRDGIAAAPALERHLGARLVATIRPLYVRVLELSPGELTGALDALRHDPAVRYAQREGVVRALRIPNDAFWSTQWSPLKTRAPLAWDLTTGSKDVVIAVVDTGVDPAQPDLLGKLVQGYDYVENDASPGDDNGHGTAVAGIPTTRTVRASSASAARPHARSSATRSACSTRWFAPAGATVSGGVRAGTTRSI